MEHVMISRRHHIYKQRLKRHLDQLEKLNDDEEKQMIAEVAKIKRSRIRKFGQPKPVTDMPLKGLVSGGEDTPV